jgi:hypothetical protein
MTWIPLPLYLISQTPRNLLAVTPRLRISGLMHVYHWLRTLTRECCLYGLSAVTHPPHCSLLESVGGALCLAVATAGFSKVGWLWYLEGGVSVVKYPWFSFPTDIAERAIHSHNPTLTRNVCPGPLKDCGPIVCVMVKLKWLIFWEYL